jgi:hypothetical protein
VRSQRFQLRVLRQLRFDVDAILSNRHSCIVAVFFDGNQVADDRLGLPDAHFTSHSARRLILRYLCIGRVGRRRQRLRSNGSIESDPAK